MDYILIRKNIKNLHLRVKAPDGRLEVTAPLLLPKSSIDRFVASKASWIEKQRAKISDAGEARELTPGDRKELARRMEEFVPRCEALTGLKASCWKIRSMRTRWGSCNIRTKSITLALQLALKDDIFLQKVILHELCHLRVAGHGPQFKALLKQYESELEKELAKTQNIQRG